jgi:hypothetical protein
MINVQSEKNVTMFRFVTGSWTSTAKSTVAKLSKMRHSALHSVDQTASALPEPPVLSCQIVLTAVVNIAEHPLLMLPIAMQAVPMAMLTVQRTKCVTSSTRVKMHNLIQTQMILKYLFTSTAGWTFTTLLNAVKAVKMMRIAPEESPV